MSVTTVNNKKVISLAVGAVADGAYLWAGADKSLQKDIEGKSNGATLNYRKTYSGAANAVDADSITSRTASDWKEVEVGVKIRDYSNVVDMGTVQGTISAFGEDGEVKVRGRQGAKLAKKAVKDVAGKDLKAIANWFKVASGSTLYKAVMKAAGFVKQVSGEMVFGFADNEVWGELEGEGRNGQPIAVSEATFGKDLKGSLGSIGELRVAEIPQVSEPTHLTDLTAKWDKTNKKIVLKSTAGGTLKAGTHFQLPGFYTLDCEGNLTSQLFTFIINADISLSAATDADLATSKFNSGAVDMDAAAKAIDAISATSVTYPLDASSTYAVMIVRPENGQCFASMKDVNCKGAQYMKSEYAGVTVHENVDADVKGFKSSYAWDMVIACQNVAPEMSAVVAFKL